MNNYLRHLILLLVLFIQCYACQEQQQIDSIPEKWEVLEIKIEDRQKRERIGVFYNDSCSYTKTVFDTVYFKKHGEYFSEKYRFFLSKNDKEALHLLFIDAIEHPVGSTTKASCYVGENITLTLNKYGDPEISCHYSSVHKMWNISKTMLEIKRLAFKNIKHRADA